MAEYYQFTDATFGSGTQIDGVTADYGDIPQEGSTWEWSGSSTTFTVARPDGKDQFIGDPNDEQILPPYGVGDNKFQTTMINGVETAVLWDYTFEVTDPSTGIIYTVGVIDVDLDGNGIIEGEENGYLLVFPDGPPPEGVELVVGEVTEDDNRTSMEDLGGVVVCFASGTLIETSDGPRAIETLKPGDKVKTRDHGFQTLRWIGQTRVAARGKFAPIVISKGALGNKRDLVVSPLHGILITDWRAQFLFGQEEVMARAKDLVNGDTIYRRPQGSVTYVHMLFDRHEIVFSEGIASESLYPGDVALGAVSVEARDEILTLFPKLRQGIENYGQTAVPMLKGFEATCLAA